jgi:phospholipid/cholesterol/gamma-HCH transport system substrate-binding protein
VTRSRTDVAVGVFVALGVLALAWLSIQLGRVELFGSGTYTVTADFPATGGLKPGANVEIAGVQVGRVKQIGLADYQARLTLTIDNGVVLQDDSIASIKTRGIIGEKYLEISPGGSDKQIPPGGRITEVSPPLDLEELLSKYVFGGVGSGGGASGPEAKPDQGAKPDRDSKAGTPGKPAERR